jgi:hypothetical protein
MEMQVEVALDRIWIEMGSEWLGRFGRIVGDEL